jgi:hypothetical protein
MLSLSECSRNLGSNPSRASFCYPPSRMDCYAGSLESPSSQLSFACNCGLYLKGDLFLIASNVLSDIVTSTTCRENMANEYERPQLWQKTNERPVRGSTWSPLSLIFIGDLTFSYTGST